MEIVNYEKWLWSLPRKTSALWDVLEPMDYIDNGCLLGATYESAGPLSFIVAVPGDRAVF